MAKSVYEIIKKQNGEAFAKAIRNFDSGIFEIENLPHIVKFAGRNALPLLPFLESLKKIELNKVQTDKDPFQMLQEAGYDAFYVDSLEKQNSIQKYFENDERLCTFHDEKRFQNYHIIHAVKKNVDEIKRENFRGKEAREDEYGRSVISIQISKVGGFIKICNRYNHTVNYSDNTFNSNPNNIINGLSQSLRNYFKIDFQIGVETPEGFIWEKNCLFKFYKEKFGVYLGENFYLKNGSFYKINKDYQFVVGDWIFDLKNKKVQSVFFEETLFSNIMTKMMQGKKVTTSIKKGKRYLFIDDKLVMVSSNNKNINKYMDYLYLPNITELPSLNSFFYAYLDSDGFPLVGVLKMPHLKKLGSNWFSTSKIGLFYAPNLEGIGDNCFCNIENKSIFLFPKLKCMGNNCFCNVHLRQLNFQHLDQIGKACFCDLTYYGEACFSNLIKMGSDCFQNLSGVTRLKLPKLDSVLNGQIMKISNNLKKNSMLLY